MGRMAVNAKGAKVLGPYSQAVASGELLFLSGQVPLDSATGALVTGDIAAQTAQSLRNLAAVLAADGLSLDDVVKTTVFLTDMTDFSAMNTEYAKHFAPPCPARSAIEVGALPMGAQIEIEAIARRR